MLLISLVVIATANALGANAQIVVAHFMTQNAFSYSEGDWTNDINTAKATGIDGFGVLLTAEGLHPAFDDYAVHRTFRVSKLIKDLHSSGSKVRSSTIRLTTLLFLHALFITTLASAIPSLGITGNSDNNADVPEASSVLDIMVHLPVLRPSPLIDAVPGKGGVLGPM
ncbi:hypothetical protein FB451DRAFT_1396652 [Mycena latifolia]|nr:hypothetical protein FB451DRAFT_1396652 [Mycena latifolia]